jgi:hypothetical protein
MNNPTVRNLYAHITQDELDELRAKVADHDRVVQELRAENEALACNLRGKHDIAGATYAASVRERDSLMAELSACKSPPGGCGYWRESARIREQERDTLRAEVVRLRVALEKIASETAATWVCDVANAALAGGKGGE